MIHCACVWLCLTLKFTGSGQLSERELRAALVNGDWTSFDPHTVRMKIKFVILRTHVCETQLIEG